MANVEPMPDVLSPEIFKRLADARFHIDGKHLLVMLETSEQTIPLEIPLEEIGDIIQFLVAVHLQAPNKSAERIARHSPIPVLDAGAGIGPSQDDVLVQFDLAGHLLSFQIHRTQAEKLQRALAHTLSAAAVHTGRAN